MTIQRKLEQKKNKSGLVGTRLNFSRPTKGRGIEEHITHDWQEIVVKVRKDIDLAPDEETKRYLRRINVLEDPVEIVATDLLYHGCGHRELPTSTGLGCPFTVVHHDQILDGVTRALKEKGKQGLESYVSNAFEDVLDNINARRHTRHAGQILFWNNEGLESKDKKFPSFYEAFVKTNLVLWGSPEDGTLLKRFYTNSEKVQRAVAEFKEHLKTYLDSDIIVKIHEKDDLFEKLFSHKKHWRELAYRFTLAMADLLEQKPEMRMCFGMPTDGELPFDKEMKLPDTQERLAYERYKAGDRPSEHTDSLLQLDALYRKISRSIPVKTSTYTKSTGIPLIHYGRRDLKEDETIKVNRVKGIGITDDGGLTVKVARHDLYHPAMYKVHPRQFPALKIAVIDRSGSMAQSPQNDNNVGNTTFIPWGDNSKYHYALKGIYGVDNFLEKQGIAQYVHSEVVTFSDTTLRTGKGMFRNQQERHALLRKPSGGTNIDANVIASTVAEKTFLISISDGDIANWDDQKEIFQKAVLKADYCHIQIGTENQFTQDLKQWGIPVHCVKGDDDLSALLLDVTSTYYKKGDFS